MYCRQEDPAPNSEPNVVDLNISQTITEDMYFSACDKIDSHNRCRQESLDTKTKLGTIY